MSNPDKHKTLSAQELFKLLESQSSKENAFDGLDDFEKDALDGFSAHSSAKKAKALTEELNTAISTKVASTGSSAKNKVIWFSAAASIVLIVLLSVFFFNQTKKNSETNLALSEEKEPQFQSSSQSQTALENKNVIEESIAVPESKPKSTDDVVANDESKDRAESETNAIVKQGAGLPGKSDADKKIRPQPNLSTGSTSAKEKSKLEESQINDEATANKNITAISASSNSISKIAEQEEAYYKADQSANQEQTKQKTQQSSMLSKKSADIDKTNSGPGGNVTANSAPISLADKNNNAYYIGSNLAIRDYVVSYFKQKAITNEAAGKFKISGTVDAKGNFKVIDIIQITRNNCNCVDNIKKALNSMTEWVPAIKDDKTISSNVEFEISF